MSCSRQSKVQKSVNFFLAAACADRGQAEAKCLRPRPRPRPKLWRRDQGRGQNFGFEALTSLYIHQLHLLATDISRAAKNVTCCVINFIQWFATGRLRSECSQRSEFVSRMYHELPFVPMSHTSTAFSRDRVMTHAYIIIRVNLQGSCPLVKIKFKDFSRTFKDHTRFI